MFEVLLNLRSVPLMMHKVRQHINIQIKPFISAVPRRTEEVQKEKKKMRKKGREKEPQKE